MEIHIRRKEGLKMVLTFAFITMDYITQFSGNGGRPHLTETTVITKQTFRFSIGRALRKDKLHSLWDEK